MHRQNVQLRIDDIVTHAVFQQFIPDVLHAIWKCPKKR